MMEPFVPISFILLSEARHTSLHIDEGMFISGSNSHGFKLFIATQLPSTSSNDRLISEILAEVLVRLTHDLHFALAHLPQLKPKLAIDFRSAAVFFFFFFFSAKSSAVLYSSYV